MKLDKTIKYFLDSDYRFLVNASVFHRYDNKPDKWYLEKKYKAMTGEKLNFENPKRFNEKMQWLKLYDRRPEYVAMVDKHIVKKYVADIIGEEHIVPTLGVWDRPDDIDFESLPNQFALKCNHNSGLGMYICRDKTSMDIEVVKRNLQNGIAEDYYNKTREWPYKDVPRKIIAEKYLTDESGELTDYKVHCFNGVPKYILVCKDRFKESGLTEDFFTPEWEHMDVKRPKNGLSKEPIPRPKELDEILEYARKLSKDIPFVRVDFYIINGKVYFSELTFFPASGFVKYEPDKWDYIFGEWIELPNE